MTQQGSLNPESKLVKNATGVSIEELSFEHVQDTLGIGTSKPRLSWIVGTNLTGWSQTAYEIEAYNLDGQLFGQTGRIESAESVLLPWPFAPLVSRQSLKVRLRVWGGNDQPSEWSTLTPIEVGLLKADDWTAQFITPDWEEDTSQPQPCPMLRREFKLRPGIQSARLYVTALGVYEVQLNGSVVGDAVFAPGWTSYALRLRYQTFDITSLLQEGNNVIGAILGDGWFRGRLGFHGGRRNIYGDRLALLAQVEIQYQDGTSERITSDVKWRAAPGPILASDLYDGETYDARLEKAGWSEPGFDDHDWAGVRRIERDFTTLVAPAGPPVRRMEVFSPVAITTSPLGRTIIDFGQNLVGRIRLTVQGQAGQTVTLRHAEVLEDGELCTRPLRLAKATDRYTLRGEGSETWEPRFTFHGFRYVEVTGWPGQLQDDTIKAVVLYSDMERTGWFECSDPLINRLHENVVWSMRGNFFDIPTDCPQRDERLGWTGDIQVFAPTATFLYDCAGFLTSWLADLSAEQTSDGNVPNFVPNVAEAVDPPAAAWGDAAVIVPWVLYQRFGDKEILERHFDSMRAWVDLIARIAGDGRLWNKGIQFGDWLDPAAPPDKPGEARTPAFVVASAYFARSADLVGKVAGILGQAKYESYYMALAEQVRKAFNDQYVTPAGWVIGDSATAYALALQFELLANEVQRVHAGKRLAALVRANRYHINTGFVGTPLICDALFTVGEHETAFRLLTQRDCPSWLYPVIMGATTIWERWDSLLPDGSVNPGEMTSFNHYALGAVADWLHRSVAGLAPAAPGYRVLDIQPRPGGGLTYARARHTTPYGTAESSWKIDDGAITIEASVPPNTTARVTLPGNNGKTFEVGSGKHRWSYPYPSPKNSGPELSLDMTLDELIDNPEAHARLVNILSQYNPELTARIDGLEGVSLRQAISMMPSAEEALARIESALKLMAESE